LPSPCLYLPCFGTPATHAAAAAFLLFGNPALAQRLGGVFVRAQSETFVALAITAAVALLHWTPAHWSVDGVA